MDKILLTADEVAACLHIGRTSVYRLLQAGELVGVRIGASRRFPWSEIEAYVQRLAEGSRG